MNNYFDINLIIDNMDGWKIKLKNNFNKKNNIIYIFN